MSVGKGVVKVTFKYDGGDEQDSTGLTEDEFTELQDGIMQLGGYDVEFEKEEEAV